MDYETVSAEDFGASLRGLGLNLIVPDVAREIAFLTGALEMTAHRASADFAIMVAGGAVLQLHSDGTYSGNPYQALLPENPPRGAGAELRLYDIDPDIAAGKTEAAGGMILQAPTDKPHGLREAFLLSPAGFCWVPSRPLSQAHLETPPTPG
jgi:catechol 2,3-dioxygenase-like lactoylglutathione lyase family enzyme